MIFAWKKLEEDSLELLKLHKLKGIVMRASWTLQIIEELQNKKFTDHQRQRFLKTFNQTKEDSMQSSTNILNKLSPTRGKISLIQTERISEPLETHRSAHEQNISESKPVSVSEPFPPLVKIPEASFLVASRRTKDTHALRSHDHLHTKKDSIQLNKDTLRNRHIERVRFYASDDMLDERRAIKTKDASTQTEPVQQQNNSIARYGFGGGCSE